MRVFISWSGERSKTLAEILRNWLPKVIQAVTPWMSKEDIASGTRWSAEISKELEDSKVGIICVTPENQNNSWIMFETGALSKTISQTYVCPYLFGLGPSQLVGPLSQFQASVADKEGTRKILHALNKALNDKSIKQEELDEIFDVWWPKLESNINQIPKEVEKTEIKRSHDDLLAELVENTREQLRREEVRLETSKKMYDKLDQLGGFMDHLMKIELPKFENKSMNNFLETLGINKENIGIPFDLKQFSDMIENIKEVKDIDKDFMTKMLQHKTKKDQ